MQAGRSRAFLIVAFVTACGPTQSTSPAEPAVAKPKPGTVAPPPPAPPDPRKQALILGTSAAGGRTVVPLVGKESRRPVDVMWVRKRTGRPLLGGSSEVWLATKPQQDHKVRVGMFEQFAEGMGSQWRAAVWMSSFIAATILGKDLTDFRFSAEAGGYIDGASAGALMTTGFLASMTGATIDPKTTMTGIVNPDGTVGPVGGIPQKFLGSIKKGKTRLGYPIGLRRAYDMDKRRRVDLHELAKTHNVEAKEIRDVYEAYEFLTGKRLPVPVPVSEAEMTLEANVLEKLQHHYTQWRQLLSEQWAELVAIDNAGKLPPGLVAISRRARKRAQRAEHNLKAQRFVAAYRNIIEAAVFATAANAAWKLAEKISIGDVPGALQTLNRVEQQAQFTEAALRKAGEGKPKSIGDYLRMISGFHSAITGWGFHAVASGQLSKSKSYVRTLRFVPMATLTGPAVKNTVIRTALPALVAMLRAVAHTRAAIEAQDIEGVQGLDYTCSLANARNLSESYASAAAANLRYFKALHVDGVAKRQRLTETQARIRVMVAEPDYLVAFMASRLPRITTGIPPKLKKEWGETSLSWTLGTLAGSILSYFKTSLLVSKFYSLKVTTNPFTGVPYRVQHANAFRNMLTVAQRRSREQAHAAKVATGSIPVQARLHYQYAKTLLTSGDLQSKLQALELFWESSVYSQTAVMLAR